MRLLWYGDDDQQDLRPVVIPVVLYNQDGPVVVVNLYAKSLYLVQVSNLAPYTAKGETAEYHWEAPEILGYVRGDLFSTDGNSALVYQLWKRPDIPETECPKRIPGNSFVQIQTKESQPNMSGMFFVGGACVD